MRIQFRAISVVLLGAGLLQPQSDVRDAGSEQWNPAAVTPQAPPFVSCPAGAPLGGLDLEVQEGDQHLPLRTMNHLSEGDTLLYRPIVRGRSSDCAIGGLCGQNRAGGAIGGDAIQQREFRGKRKCRFKRVCF